jgi:hypothetical protein
MPASSSAERRPWAAPAELSPAVAATRAIWDAISEEPCAA